MAVLLERRRAAKWNKHVAATAASFPREQVALSSGNGYLFPYRQLEIFTKDFLGKRTRSQEQTDKKLIDLIKQHPSKELAFAAVAGALSDAAVQELVDSEFDVDPVTLDGLEIYLSVFVAAAHCKEEAFSKIDQRFALALLPLARDVAQQNAEASTARALFRLWTTGPPSDRLLLSRAKSLTKVVCERIASELDLNDRELWCKGALKYKDVLPLLRMPYVELEDCLYAAFPLWRSWAYWIPDWSRIQVWSTVPKTNAFSSFRELEGPDTDPVGQPNGTQWRALIRKGRMLGWIERKVSRLGVGLVTGDSEELLQIFVQNLLDTVVYTLKTSPLDVLLLQLFMKHDDFDSQTLEAYQGATAVLDLDFISIVTLPRRRAESQAVDTITVKGLQALRSDAARCMRDPLRESIALCALRARDMLHENFVNALSKKKDWIKWARRLWALRSEVAQAVWLHPFLDDSLVSASKSQASHVSLESLAQLYNSLEVEHSGLRLYTSMQNYVQTIITDGYAVSEFDTMLAEVLHNLWCHTDRVEVRAVALLIVSLPTDFAIAEQIVCVRQLPNISSSQLQELQRCWIRLQRRGKIEIVPLTRAITLMARGIEFASCWQDLLRWALKEYNVRVDEPMFTSLGFTIYRRWIGNLYEMFAASLELVPSINTWLSALQPFQWTLDVLYNQPDSGTALHSLLTLGQTEVQQLWIKMLQILQAETRQQRIELMQSMLVNFNNDLTQTDLLRRAVSSITSAPDEAFLKCQQLVTTCHQSRAVGAVRLAIWLKDPFLDSKSESALRSLGDVLRLGLDADSNPSLADRLAAKGGLDQRVSQMIEIAQRLEQTRMLLRKKDPTGVETMADTLGIEQSSGAAALIADLPHDLLDVVEESSEDAVLLTFPLSSATMLERLAFGLKGTETLFVHLRVSSAGEIDGFCVHLEEGHYSDDNFEHKYFGSKLEFKRYEFIPDRLLCRGRPTRLTYLVARSLYQQFYTGQNSLKDLYERTRKVLHDSPMRCMICLGDIRAPRHRPTTCSDMCTTAYRRSDLEVRIGDVRSDVRAVDLLLTSVFAAASVGNLNLLTNRPNQLSDAGKLLTLLNCLPATAALAKSNDMGAELRSRGQRAELLVSWLLNHYRGFLVTAPDRYRIPNMPGNVLQFLLVDNPPDVEAGFAKHIALEPRLVYFHGTSMDRLYPILAEGLRVLSGTDLMRNGQAHGKGIYLAREPSYAMGFSKGVSAARSCASNQFFDSRSEFDGPTVLLGCEHAGNPNSGGPANINVVTDPTKVIVRYIFIVPKGTKLPQAKDLWIPMLSTFSDLRATAVHKLA